VKNRRIVLRLLLTVTALVIVVVVTALSAFGATKASLSFTTAPQTTSAGQSSGLITVALSSGFTGPATVKLTTTSTTGSFRNATDTTTVTSVSIGSGETQTSFRYRDTTAGTPTITAAAASTAATKQWTGNLSGSQTEKVVPAAAERLTVSPETATITSGQSQTYVATGFDKYGNSLGNVTAQTTFSISPNGSCKEATCTAGKAGSHTVTGTDGTATGQASLSVNAGSLDHIVVSPKTSSITAGGSQSYTAEGFDAAGNDLGNVTAQTTFSISPDGSCQEATCTATKAGEHTVAATDGGLSDQASLSVTAGSLGHIVISPKTASTTAGESQPYTAAGFDRYGNSLGDATAQTTFSISPDGSCQEATCIAKSAGKHTVTATDGGVSDEATLSVAAGPLDHIVISPQSATITAGASEPYTAAGFDRYGNSLGDVTAQTTFSISPNGSCQEATCQAHIQGAHTVTGTDGTATGEAGLTVTAGTLDHLVVSPKSGQIAAGESQAYTAEGFDAAGNDLGDVTAQSTFTISPDGTCVGAFCGASNNGIHTVTATDGTASGEATLSVGGGTLDHIVISPKTASIAAGESQAYTAEGFDAAGNDLGNVTGQTTFTVSPDGSCQEATCTATKAGEHTVTGTDRSATDTAQLSVSAGAFDHIVISPKTATITAGASQAFTAEAFDHYGNDLGDVTSSTTFSISPNGSCQQNECSATKAGKDTVTATKNGSSDEAQLTVQAGAPNSIVISPKSSSISAGGSQAYKAEAFDQAGNSLGDVTGQTTFTISPDGSCREATCTATKAGEHTVTATDGAMSDTAQLSVSAAGFDHIVIAPKTATITAGASQAYSAEAYDHYGNDLGDVTSTTTFSISPNGSCQEVSCTAAKAGEHTVIATHAGSSDEAQLTVQAGAPSSIVISPKSSSITAGGSQAYTAEAFDQSGNSLGDVTAQTSFSIAPDGSCQEATCTASQAGPHTVTATDGAFSGQASLGVNAGSLSRIVLSPKTATITTGGSQAYTAEGFDAAGNDLGNVTAQTTFSISPDGSCQEATCTASKSGEHAVTASDSGVSDQGTLQVKSPATTVSLTFDDADADQMEAGRILAGHSMHGTFFVPTGRVGTPGYMSVANLETLAASGNEMADHTVNHINLLNVSAEEAERQVCNARVQLENWGFPVWDFAYPQGGTSPELEQIVQKCNLNSARVVGNIVSPGDCFGCAYSETIPPRNPWAIATPDSIKSSNTLQEIKNYVIQAQEHGGGWVPLVFHHVCNECDPESVTAPTLRAFLDWLHSEEGNGVTVKTMHEVIGGESKPAVTGPAPPPPSGDLIKDPSLEEDLNANGVPDCWTVGGSGTNTWSAGMTSDAHSGDFAEHMAISNFTSGDRRLVTTQDLGQCAPPATPGDSYTASSYIKGEGTIKWVVYYRNSTGTWTYWTQSAAIPVTSSYNLVSWKTPAVPSEATALSVGYSLRSVGNFTADDFYLKDNGAADTTPPTISLTAPTEGSTVSGTTYITANATDNLGVASVKFYLDGTLLGSKTSPTTTGGSTYQWKWETGSVSEGQHTLTAVATDAADNQATAAPVKVTVVHDTTPPTTTILCNGSTACSGWFKAAVTVTLQATDNVAVAKTVYTTDGSEPSATNGTVYTGAFSVPQTATVKFRSVDTSGNWEQVESQLVQIDTTLPVVSLTAPTEGATVIGTTYINATATDNVGVASVRFYLDGTLLGSKTSPTTTGGSTYQWKWESAIASEGQHTLTAIATDTAGNQTTSAPVTVTVVHDTTPPTTTILCNGSTSCSGWFKEPVSVTLKATDNGAVAQTYYTTDGSEPTATNGIVYTSPFSVPQTTTVKFRSVDTSGNWEQVESQLLQIDTTPPSTHITSPTEETKVTGTVYIKAEATDNISVASVRFYLDGVSLGSKTTPTTTGGSTYQWKWETGTTTKGSHTLTVVATDEAGNKTTSVPVKVTVE
jgi:peptidoglycan/xylan/chitin deacetylase (PgdA/CDA1 family)